MPKRQKCQFKKLSDINPAESLSSLSDGLNKLRRMTETSAGLGEDLAGIVAKLRQVAAPGDQPFVFTAGIDENERLLRTVFRDCDDIKFRFFNAGNKKALLIYLGEMADTEVIESYVLQPLMNLNQTSRAASNAADIINKLVATAAISIIRKAADVIDSVMSGKTLLLIDGMPDMFVISAVKYAKRSISEPVGEDIIRGPHDAFNETLNDNLALIRRRTHDTNLKITTVRIGLQSKTAVALIYVANLVKPGLLEEIKRRLGKINTDLILSSYKIEDHIIDHPWSPFPQIQSTERPDKIVSAIYEGRVGIIVDNTPIALIVPCTYNAIMQSPEDYTSPAVVASLIILTRHLAGFIAIYLPAIYISIVSFHPGMLPTTLAISIAELRARTPFPSVLEAVLMEALLEIFQEAIIRLPKKIAGAAGVVGALVIGTTVVQAGLVNPLLVVVVATTAICSFTMPNYGYAMALRYLRAPMLVLASVLGLYGVMLGYLAITIHLCSLRSFGESYLGAILDISLFPDWKDMLIRLPISKLKMRPIQYGAQEKARAGDEDGES